MIVKEVYFYIVEMIPKHNAHDIDKCIGKYILKDLNKKVTSNKTKHGLVES